MTIKAVLYTNGPPGAVSDPTKVIRVSSGTGKPMIPAERSKYKAGYPKLYMKL
jgi:hypothetical protein